ncbi:serine/threonine-protein kinase-like protein CCR4 [Zingiber officinale]|uniref:Protein kinase domain-containing protein n=1 Tax=Zingiber officinale TaxID=94328 RepID=A0A8J5FSH8_ZINOF|nr:serine/threonine-protein kinase-like protein CCR4 [Zingiber officinale]KAG6495200.1 hypothetical protein ZIOFF_042992 [Zingiber officinale]
MPSPTQSQLHLHLLLSLSSLLLVLSSPFSTVAISRLADGALVCALVPSQVTGRPFDLTCTSTASWRRHSYGAMYSAVAAGDGFLCGLTSPADGDSNVNMRWWEFRGHGSDVYEKKIYQGSPLAALASGDTHVCGLSRDAGRLRCWRWAALVVPDEASFCEIAVGRDFLCGRLRNDTIRCFGNDAEIVGKEPAGKFSMVAAGTRHACGAEIGGGLICWGVAPQFDPVPLEVVAMALGENKTCVLQSNGTVLCWGHGALLPDYLAGEQFVAIQAKGDTICGIVKANYSLVCWGNDVFRRNHTLYDRVLPGTCMPATNCPCDVLPGSGSMCISEDEAICELCKFKVSPNSSNNSPAPEEGIEVGSKRKVLFLVLGSVGVGLGLVALLTFFVSVMLRKKRNGSIEETSGRSNRPPPVEGRTTNGTIEEFAIQFLLEVTNGFSESHKIGSGSFGAVYRAMLLDRREVAIKRADIQAAPVAPVSRRHEQLRLRGRKQRERAFESELALLSRINHKNLVRLLGFCRERDECVLVYEYMANGTLHDHLHRKPMGTSSPLGSWPERLRVALDAARGIEYLHSYAVPAIIHRDIKSTNILLDEEWTAKVADFGLSLTSPDEEDSVDAAAGTVGYMDPEYYRLRRLTEKSDVYSLGVVLLELVTGCKAVHQGEAAEGGEGCSTPRNLVEMAVPWIEVGKVERVIDRRVVATSAEEAEAMAYMGHLAAECVRAEGRRRPSMGAVVMALKRALRVCSGEEHRPRFSCDPIT